MIFATASRQSSYSSVIILALQREGSIFPMSEYINSAEFIDFEVIQENDTLTLPFFTHNTLKYSLPNFPKREQSSTPTYNVHMEVRCFPVWIYHISKILISVHLHFLYTCQLICSTTQEPLHRNLLFLCQPPRTLYSFQDLVQGTIAFQALCSIYCPVTPSRWHKYALFQKDIFSPQLPSFLALYVFKFQL